MMKSQHLSIITLKGKEYLLIKCKTKRLTIKMEIATMMKKILINRMMIEKQTKFHNTKVNELIKHYLWKLHNYKKKKIKILNTIQMKILMK